MFVLTTVVPPLIKTDTYIPTVMMIQRELGDIPMKGLSPALDKRPGEGKQERGDWGKGKVH